MPRALPVHTPKLNTGRASGTLLGDFDNAAPPSPLSNPLIINQVGPVPTGQIVKPNKKTSGRNRPYIN